MRNNQTQRFSQRQALRLHQGLVTSTAEQVASYYCHYYYYVCSVHKCVPACNTPCLCVSKVMERLCVRVQQQVCVLRGVGEMEEIQAAKQVLKEARNSRAVSSCQMVSTLCCERLYHQPSWNECTYFSPSCTLHFASWLMCCQWTGR